jgi:hypothetical protein
MVQGKLSVAKLRAAIKLFESKKTRGEPWPDPQLQGQDSGQQRSV